MVESLIAAIQQGKVTYPDGWLVGELESLTAEKTSVGTRYKAPEGLHDDGVMGLCLAWKGYSTVIHPVTSRPNPRDVPEGVSAGYDYKSNKPRTKETGEEASEQTGEDANPAQVGSGFAVGLDGVVRKVLQVARIGELIYIDQTSGKIRFCQHIPDKITPNKTTPACDQHVFHDFALLRFDHPLNSSSKSSLNL